VAVERFEARPRLASAFAYGRRGSPGGTSDRPSCGLPGSLAAEAEHGAVGTRTEDARTQSGEVLGGVPSVPPSEVRTGTTTDRGRSLGRRAARKLRMFGEDSPQPGAQRRALPFFSDDRLEHLDVESLVGNELLEPPILLFELLQPPRLVDLHASELRFPAVEGGRRDAQFPANVLHLHAGVGLFERVDDLFLGVPALPHEPYPTRLGSRFAWSTFWGQGHRRRPSGRYG